MQHWAVMPAQTMARQHQRHVKMVAKLHTEVAKVQDCLRDIQDAQNMPASLSQRFARTLIDHHSTLHAKIAELERQEEFSIQAQLEVERVVHRSTVDVKNWKTLRRNMRQQEEKRANEELGQ